MSPFSQGKTTMDVERCRKRMVSYSENDLQMVGFHIFLKRLQEGTAIYGCPHTIAELTQIFHDHWWFMDVYGR